MQDANNLTIRPAARRDLEMVLDWAAAEGWNPGIRDAVPFFAADPNGYRGVVSGQLRFRAAA